MALSMHNDSSKLMDSGKYVRYTPEQVEALERVYMECPKPTSVRRQQLIREYPILSNIEPKQIKVWFQNRRCREKQRKESSRLQSVNKKLNAMNTLLMEENDRLQKQVSNLVYENGYMKQQLRTVPTTTADTSCESAVVCSQSKQQNPTTPHPPRDANSPAGLLAIAEETLTVFLSKAKGTAVDWVQIIGMKPGPESIGIVALSCNSTGIAARAIGLVSLEPTKVAEILKDRLSWYRDCRRLDVQSVIPKANGGTIELIYMQTYAPTILASARDFWTLRFTTALEDGSIVICERSLTSSTGGLAGPTAAGFVRASMHPSGYLISPCDGGGSTVHIVDHLDLDAGEVPEILRPLYESSRYLAQKMTIAALQHVRQIAHETSGDFKYSSGYPPAISRAFSQRLSRGFNDAVNGFSDDGWTVIGNEGIGDVSIAINSSPGNYCVSQYNMSTFVPSLGGGVLCAKTSMVLQNVPPALLIRFLREHRSEWADYAVDTYCASTLKSSAFPLPFSRPESFPSCQEFLTLASTFEQDEILEMVRLKGHAFAPEDVGATQEMLLMQLCSGIGESALGACAQLVFAPLDPSLGDDSPLIASGFRVIPLATKAGGSAAARTLDLASSLEAGNGTARFGGEADSSICSTRSVLTIAFQFSFSNHIRDNVAAMAQQYVRSIMGSVQRVAMAISPSPLNGSGPKLLPGSTEASTLARWICSSYRNHTGEELLCLGSKKDDAILMQLWDHPDAILSCSLKPNASLVFTFANKAGLNMLETTLVALQDIMLDKILDETGRKSLYSEFNTIMQQGTARLPAGLCVSSMNRPVSYEQVIVWRLVNDNDVNHSLAFMFVNWSFL